MRARGPGRVNLIGEHTDYNDGLCLPFAAEAGITVEVEPGEPGVIEAHALEYGEEDRFDAGDPQPAEGWRAFVRGTVAELNKAGLDVPGARLRIESDLPRGRRPVVLRRARVRSLPRAARPRRRSSSPTAATSPASARASSTTGSARRPGMLDQMAAFFGAPGHALLLDCRDLSVEQVPLTLGGWTLGVADSGSRHEHTDSGYNERRRECAEACPAARCGEPARRDERGSVSPSRSTGASATC